SDVGVVPITGGPATIVGRTPGTESSPRWVDAQRLVFQRVTDDLRTREIVIAEADGRHVRTLARDADEKWWSVPASSRPEPEPSPDGRWVAFLSDRDGWDHLYVVATAGGTPVQLTRGAFEVRRPRWAHDSRRMVFDANEGTNPGQRHLRLIDMGSDPAAA